MALKVRERIVKILFGDVIRNEIQKSSRQIVTEIIGINSTEGLLPQIDFEIFNQMYEQTSWVRAVVGVICKAVTARGYSFVPIKAGADEKEAELLTEFFANCNPNDTTLEILDDITRDEYVFGNAFLEIVNGVDGKPKELWNLDATTMRVKADQHADILGYVQIPRFAAAGTQTGRVDFDPQEVIHFKLGTKGATLYGLSPLASLILPITVDKFAQVYNRAFFVNGAKIRGAFIMKDATPEQVERNREYLQARAKNPDLAHSDLVLEGQIEFKQIGVNQKDMEFLHLREFTRSEILAVYGVPPSKVSVIETGHLGAGTGEHQTQTFYDETIVPFQMRVADKITKHIIRQGFGITDWAFQFNKRSIDEKEQAEVFNIYLQNGVFTAEEVRGIVAPRMPDIQKALAVVKASKIQKSKLGPRQTIVHATSRIVALENRFVGALKNLFRNIRNRIASKLPGLARQHVVSKIKKLKPQFETYSVHYHGIDFRRTKPNEVIKQLDDIEGLLELIDQDSIAKLVEQFSLEAARDGFKSSTERSNLENVDNISRQLEEMLENNAIDLAANVSQSIAESLRQSIIEGLAANETISELQARIKDQLDTIATIAVGPVFDSDGNVIREGYDRDLSSDSVAEMIARTEANRAFNQGNLDALKQADVQEVVFLLAPDACEECRDVSESADGDKFGKTMSIEDASDVIPVHPNCRCTWITSDGVTSEGVTPQGAEE